MNSEILLNIYECHGESAYQSRWEAGSRKGKEYGTGRNRDYTFEVERSFNEGEPLPWGVTSVSHQLSPGSNDRIRNKNYLHAMRGLVLHDFWLPQAFKDGWIVFTNAEFLSECENKLVQAEFVIQSNANHGGGPFQSVVKSGTVVFDPENFWLIQSAELQGL